MRLGLKVTIVCGFAVLAFLALGNGRVFASPPGCDVLADNKSESPLGSGNVRQCLLSYSKNNALTGVSTPQQFVARINALASSGDLRQQYGARYIESHISSTGAKWSTTSKRLTEKGSDVTMKLGWYNPGCYNTAFYPGHPAPGDPYKDSYIGYEYDCGTFYSLEFYVNGDKNPSYVIKVDCGNPLGGLAGLPAPSATNHLPTGSMSPPVCATSVTGAHTYTFSYSFSDADGRSAARAAGFISSGAYTADQTGYALSYTTAASPYTSGSGKWSYTGGWPGTVGGTYHAVWLRVADIQPDGSHTWGTLAGVNEPSCPPPVNKLPQGACPGDPTITANTIVNIATPYNTPYGSGSWSGQVSSQFGAVQYQDVAYGNSGFSIKDLSPSEFGGNSVALSFAPPPTSTSQSVGVNYDNYVKTYPYDHNQAQVGYFTDYHETTWRATSFAYYLCDNGTTTRSANSCYDSYDPCFGATASHSGNCYYAVGGYTQSNCPYTWYSTIGCAYSYSAVCSWGYSADFTSTSNTCYRYYTGTPYWYYVNSGTVDRANYNTSNGYTMNACFNRGFKLTSGSVTTGLNDNEDPTSASSTANGTVTFTPAPGTGYRVQPTANINYQTQYSGGDANCNITGSMTVGSASPFSQSNSCPAHAPPLEAGDTVCAAWTFSPSGDYVDINGTPQPDNNPQDNNGQGNGQSISESGCSSPVYNEPYAQFFGNDVSAGGAFAKGYDQCASENPSNGGNILAWLEPSVPRRGSGAQFAAIASGRGGSINQFSTALLRSSAPTSIDGLMFANSPLGASLGTSHCIPDYYGNRPTTGASPSPIDTTNAGNRYYELSGNQAFNGFTVSPGVNVTIYVNGSVTINGNITYSGANGGWSVNGNTTNVPSLYIIAKGGINISGNVSELDGVYVAQGGAINTCYEDDFNICSGKQLTVYGSFIANNIELYRTMGSLRDSASGEYPGSLGSIGAGSNGAPAGNCDLGDGGNPNGLGSNPNRSYDCGAELFIFSPANYLSQPTLPPVDGSKTIDFDAISSLSPVL